jgi:hypothetical protein
VGTKDCSITLIGVKKVGKPELSARKVAFIGRRSY